MISMAIRTTCMVSYTVTVGTDFKVSRRYREDIAALADKWRRADAADVTANRFDVVNFLTSHVLPQLASQGRTMELRIVADDKERPEAWVDFGRNELCVQQFIWTAAKAQEEHARLVLAHEVGHLVLHGEQTFAFSRGQERKLGFLDPPESAECQANWFAYALLLPDAVMRRLAKLEDVSVATLSLVSEQVVRVRRREVEMDKRYRNYTGDQCPRCCNFTVMRVGITSTCDTCGLEIGSV